MNIFVTNECPNISALVLDDRRLIKMILETAQLMSTSIYCTVTGSWFGVEACEASPNKILNAQSILCNEYSKHLDKERIKNEKR